MKGIKWLDRHFEEILLVLLLFVMMIIMGIQIFARYALGNSLSWSEEITRFCLIQKYIERIRMIRQGVREEIHKRGEV